MSLVATEATTAATSPRRRRYAHQGRRAASLDHLGAGHAFATGLRAVQDIGLDVPVLSTSANMVAKQLEQ